jgi:lipopolysaccharide biosynthesis glycosyltransferase
MSATLDSNPALPTAALVLAFDPNMFHQGLLAIETIRTHCRLPHDICVLALDLNPAQLSTLAQQNIKTFTDYRSLKTYPNAPVYAHAMTCRPYLRDIFPGYDLYMWIDADIRFCHEDAFNFYLRYANANPRKIVICHEIDPTYVFLRNPPQTRAYFIPRYERMRKIYGQEAADYLHYFIPFNAGIFAMHKDCATWTSYRRNLELAMQGGFDHMAEQDAMNVSIVQDQMNTIVAPTIMNWLCSISVPAFDNSSQRFVRPEYPFLPISVLHLTNSSAVLPGSNMTFYQFYQQRNMTK